MSVAMGILVLLRFAGKICSNYSLLCLFFFILSPNIKGCLIIKTCIFK